MSFRPSSFLIRRTTIAILLMFPAFFFAIAQEAGSGEVQEYNETQETQKEELNQEETMTETETIDQSKDHQEEEIPNDEQERNEEESANELEENRNISEEGAMESEQNNANHNQEPDVNDETTIDYDSLAYSSSINETGSTSNEPEETNHIASGSTDQTETQTTSGEVFNTTGVVSSEEGIPIGTGSHTQTGEDTTDSLEQTDQNNSGTLAPTEIRVNGGTAPTQQSGEEPETAQQPQTETGAISSGDSLIFSEEAQEQGKEGKKGEKGEKEEDKQNKTQLNQRLPVPFEQLNNFQEDQTPNHMSAAMRTTNSITGSCPRELYTQLVNDRDSIGISQREHYERKLARIASRNNCQ